MVLGCNLEPDNKPPHEWYSVLMPWRPSARMTGLFICLAAFVIGAYIDAFLRANVGPTCFGCSGLSCTIVTIADHPVETIESLFPTDTKP